MFREDKTTQMAARFLTLAQGRLPYILLMKMLYLADKQMLLKWGSPITYDRWIAMQYGPVLSATLNLINSKTGQVTYWSTHIATESYDAVLKTNPGDDDLSDAEDTIIDQIFSEYGHIDQWDVVKLTHSLPEWDDPGATSTPISYERVLEDSGLFTRQDVKGILGNIAMQDEIREIRELIA